MDLNNNLNNNLYNNNSVQEFLFMRVFYQLLHSMVLVLHQHHHAPSKSSNNEENGHKREDNINVRAAMIHVIGDFIQSFGVLLASLIIFYKVSY